MKRPLIAFTAVFSAAIWVQLRFHFMHWIRHQYFLAGSIALFLFIAVCLFSKTRRYGVTLLTGFLCGLLFAHAYTEQIVKPIQQLSDSEQTFSATVQKYSNIYTEYQRVEVKVKPQELGLSSPRPNVRMMLYTPLTDERLEPGDVLQITAKLYCPDISDGFDRKTYYNGNGIYIFGKYSTEESNSKKKCCTAKYFTTSKEQAKGVWCIPLQLEESLKNNLESVLNARESGFMNAIVFGDKSSLLERDKHNLQKAGLSHLTAVSGMHIGFLVGFLLLIFGKKKGSFITLLGILCFVPMADASPSVLRAGIMYSMTAIAFLIGRENDSLNALCFAALVLLCKNPYAVFSASMLLSFFASLGLILFARRMQAYFTNAFHTDNTICQQLLRFSIGSLTASFCAILFTLPICLSLFGYVSVLSPIANLFVVGIAGFLFIFGFLLSIFCSIPLIGVLLTTIVSLLIRYILKIAELVAALPFGMIYSENIWGIGCILLVYIGVALYFVMHHYSWKSTQKKCALVPICVTILCFTVCGWHAQKNSSKIHVFPCGSGQAILFATPQETVLIDCSASSYRNAAETVREQMEWYGYDKIDTLLLTSIDKTHARNVPELLQTISVDKIIVPPKTKESEVKSSIWDTANNLNIPLTEWRENQEVFSDTIDLIGGINRKLIVKLKVGQEDFLILHSVTQKMLSTYLDTHTLSATAVILAERNIADADLLQAALQKIAPQYIILESGYGTQERILNYSVKNTYVNGEIILNLK